MFDPMATLRQIQADDRLTMTEKMVLTSVVLHCDADGTTQVGQEEIAKSSSCSSRSVRNVYQSEPVADYLSFVRHPGYVVICIRFCIDQPERGSGVPEGGSGSIISNNRSKDSYISPEELIDKEWREQFELIKRRLEQEL